MHNNNEMDLEVIPDAAQFNKQSGNIFERVFFNYRWAVILFCLIVTCVLGFQATKLSVNASYDKMLPTEHPYIANFIKYRTQIGESGNALRIVVENTQGDIYNAEYMKTLRRISDELFLQPGVFRAFMKSLWTPNTRWTGITEKGLEGGPVIPQIYTGSDSDLEEVRNNVKRGNLIGQLVALNHKSSMIYVPLLSKYPSGEPLDYGKLNASLESLREKYEKQGVHLRITGFPKIVGNLISGLRWFILFFALAILMGGGLLLWYIRCFRSTIIMVGCSLLAVVWLMGMLPLMGYYLNPYSVLVPFLVFAIGMSHGTQKMNGIVQDVGRGTHIYVAARYTFRRLFLTGATALVTDACGFIVLLLIKIDIIQELAIISSVGMVLLVVTNLILVPVLLSYTGVNKEAGLRALESEKAANAIASKSPLWIFLDKFTRKRWALGAIIVSIMLGIGAHFVSMNLTIGDIDPGAPELRPDSTYNLDNAYLTENYGASSDVFGVIIEAKPFTAQNLDILNRVDALEWELSNLEGVEYTNSMALYIRQLQVMFSEGNPKYFEIVPSQPLVNTLASRTPRGDLVNEDFSLLNLNTYLQDHKAATLSRVVAKVEDFALKYNTEECKFLMASGNAGVEAATNIVVKKANREMLYYVYIAVIILCFINFRSWRAVIVTVLPLMLTSILAEALMVWLDIGVKVATLPVIALGVGIGVDYALYILSVTLSWLDSGESLSQSYFRAMAFTGRVVVVIALTIAAGVITWVFSPIKFQADMGLMLAFMFVWNMIGAMILLPSLGCFFLKTNIRETNNSHAGDEAKDSTGIMVQSL